MDSIISLGQKNTLTEYMILSGADNRPPMLDKDLYDSWKSRMELYMQNRENGRMILESVEPGPLIWPTVEENGVIRIKKYAELSAAKKIQDDCDMKDTNIILQGLPADIYSLVNHHRVAKDLWDSSVTDASSKHLPPEGSCYNNPQLQQQFSPSQYGSIQPNQQYSSHYPSQTQFNHSSIPPSHAFQSQMNHQTSTVPQVIPQVISPQAPTQLMTESPFVDSGFVVPVFSPGDDPIACLNKAMAFLTVVASSRFPTTNNQLRTSSNPRNQATIQDGKDFELHSYGLYNNENLMIAIFSIFQYLQETTTATVQDLICSTTRFNDFILIDDFGKRFSPQQELSAEQAFWFHTLNPTTKPSYTPPVIVDVPSDLPKKRTTPSALERRSSKQKKSARARERKRRERREREGAAVEGLNRQFSVDKKCLEIAKKEILLENDRILQKIMSQDVLITVMNSMSLNNNSMNMEMLKCDSYEKLSMQLKQEVFQNDESCINQDTVEIQEYFEINDLKARLQDKDNTIFEQAKAKQPLDGELDLACKYTTRIQELLVYVQDTCPNAITPNTRKVVVTPMNNVKKVRFAEPLTSSSNSKQHPGNKKNDRISQTASRNKKNKVEAQPRKVNNSNRVVKPVCDVDVKHSLSNTNSEILCATCNKSMFDGVHDKCLLDLVQNGNKCFQLYLMRERPDCKIDGVWVTNQLENLLSQGYTNLHGPQRPNSWYGTGRLSHLNFGTLNKLAKDGLARGIPRLKFQKDHLCSACALEKSKKSSHQPKAKDTNQLTKRNIIVSIAI
ncbi:integrase, catalytic region, zinc finger, CCHC-type containing protein [Tanacetum coccineum]